MFAIALSSTVLAIALNAPIPVDATGSPLRVPVEPTEVLIVNSGSTNTLGFSLTLLKDGTATVEQGNARHEKHLPDELVTRFFADLVAAGPLDMLPPSPCAKSASFGTTTRIFYRGKASPDISCPSPDRSLQNLATDVKSLLEAADAKTILRRPLKP
jgi:hypothetical protein